MPLRLSYFSVYIFLTHSFTWVASGKAFLNLRPVRSQTPELSELMQRSLPPESRRDLTVYELRVDGVLIKPGFTSIWFRTQGREWDRQEDLKRLDRVIKAFLDSDPELQIDHFEMEEYTYESDGDSWRKRRIYRKSFDSYPLQ